MEKLTAYERNKIHKDNAYWLDKAYQNKLNYYYIKGDTMYIAGTDNMTDVYDDITKVPAWGKLTDSARYNMVKPIIDKNPQIKKLVGHSLGAVTSLRLQEQMKDRDFEVTTYGAPVIGFWGGKNTRYRHPGDMISSFDLSPFTHEILVPSVNPLTLHSYRGYTYNWDKENIAPAPSFPINQKPPSNELTQQITIPKNVNSVSTNNSYQTS